MTTDELSAAIKKLVPEGWQIDPERSVELGGTYDDSREGFTRRLMADIPLRLAPAPATGTDTALRRYGRHDADCNWNLYINPQDDYCTCGFAAALAFPAGVTVTGDAELTPTQGLVVCDYPGGINRPGLWHHSQMATCINPRPAPVPDSIGVNSGAGAHAEQGECGFLAHDGEPCSMPEHMHPRESCYHIDGHDFTPAPAPQAAAQPAPTVTPAAPREKTMYQMVVAFHADWCPTGGLCTDPACEFLDGLSTFVRETFGFDVANAAAAEAYAAQQPQKGMIAVEMPLSLAKTFASNSPSPSGYDRSTDLLASACRKALAAQQQQSTQGEAG